VKKKVVDYLVNADGSPTEAGKKLLDELRANPRMKDCKNWILRSSFSAEDRPYKSGAGQYDSFPNCRTDTQILVGDALTGGEVGGVVGVLASAWEAPPIDNNVIEEYNLMHIAPSITAMKCLNSKYSGVAISRDTDTGYRRTVSVQVVEGFGGGVEHGNTEEGRLSKDGYAIKKLLEGKNESIIAPEIQKQLRETILEIERLFHRKVEAGKGYAVDVEWVFDEDDQKLYIVQARTVRA
jgi:phosphoenolpyruvate synthase/pyruvate phosphate dikinase